MGTLSDGTEAAGGVDVDVDDDDSGTDDRRNCSYMESIHDCSLAH